MVRSEPRSAGSGSGNSLPAGPPREAPGTRLRLSDAGHYSCRPRNRLGEPSSSDGTTGTAKNQRRRRVMVSLTAQSGNPQSPKPAYRLEGRRRL
jgi:hypothetical protein